MLWCAQKMLAIITGVIGFLSTLSSLSSYGAGCFGSLPDEFTIGLSDVNMTWTHGPGFACILVATLFKPLNVIAHLMLPTPDEKTKKPVEDGASFERMA